MDLAVLAGDTVLSFLAVGAGAVGFNFGDTTNTVGGIRSGFALGWGSLLPI